MAVMLLLPLLAAPLAKLTGLALGPLFVVAVFALLVALAGASSNAAPSSPKAS
jgi:hypothetical protein